MFAFSRGDERITARSNIYIYLPETLHLRCIYVLIYIHEFSRRSRSVFYKSELPRQNRSSRVRSSRPPRVSHFEAHAGEKERPRVLYKRSAMPRISPAYGSLKLKVMRGRSAVMKPRIHATLLAIFYALFF